MSSSLALTFRHIFTRNVGGSTPASSQCMNVAAVGNDGGISLVLGLDVAAFAACVLIFLLIRYCCRSYSQMGFASRKQWAIEFHKHQNTPLLDKRHSQPPEEHDLHWYSWILKVFYKLQDTEIFSRCGPDAVLYLTLERYLIALLVIFSFLSVAVILPINYLQGDQLMAGFDRTTIANVDSKSSALWVHTLFSLVYMFIVILFMIHYTLRLGRLKELYEDVMVPESEQVSAKDDFKASKGRRPACKGTKAKANMIMVTSLCNEPTVSSITPIDGSEGGASPVALILVWMLSYSMQVPKLLKSPDPLFPQYLILMKVPWLPKCPSQLCPPSPPPFVTDHQRDPTSPFVTDYQRDPPAPFVTDHQRDPPSPFVADHQRDPTSPFVTDCHRDPPSSYQRDQSSLPSSVAASFEAKEPPARDGMTSPLPVATDKSTRKSLSSSAMTRDKLQSVAAVLEQHHRLKGEKNAGSLAIKLAKDALFGDEVLKLCTPMGNRSLPALSTKELQQRKAIIYQQFPQYANSPSEFEELWQTCIIAVSAAIL
eukprot:Em0014g669a